MSSPDLVALVLALSRTRSMAGRARAFERLEAGVVAARAAERDPGRCPTCGYKRRSRRGLVP